MSSGSLDESKVGAVLLLLQVESDPTASVESSGNPLIAIAVVVAGFIVGSLVATAVQRFTSAESRPAALQSSSAAISTLVFSLILIAALVVALGMISDEALDSLTDDFVAFIPSALSSAIVLILANVVAQLAETAVSRSLANLSPSLQRRVPTLVKAAILGFAVVIAANQLGIDTTIITVIVASLFFGLALSAALLTGLGGRSVAVQVAAGRALRQLLSVGDEVTIGELHGVIAAIGSTTTQITTRDTVVLVPNQDILDSRLTVVPRSDPDDRDDGGAESESQ